MRRLFGLVVLCLLVLGTALTSAAAQEASPAAMEGHPLAGAWTLDTAVEDQTDPPSLVIFGSDGTYLQWDVDGVPGIGSWEATGENSAALTSLFLDETGITTVRATIEVAEDGQSITASYTLEFTNPDGTETGEIGPGRAEGTRIAVEPMGDPVMSFEEFLGSPAATPDA